MARLLALLWSGCWHKWRILDSIDLMERGYRNPVGTRFNLQCEKCGNVKSKDCG